MKGKALRRALESSDALRVGAAVPLITDSTELITPTIAREMLNRNNNNRPIHWPKVEEYAATMRAGEWELHAQGIVLDTDNNILTGQKRLWAVIFADRNIYMRVSRGNQARVARLLDRGTPQTSRDLASRASGRRHSPTEASIARAYCAFMGNARPSTDILAGEIAIAAPELRVIVDGLKQIKKTKAVLMTAGAVLILAHQTTMSADALRQIVGLIPDLAATFEQELLPHRPEECWNRGAAFSLAMERAHQITVRASITRN
jgi:hypothetical protein